MPFMTSDHETKWALFLQSLSTRGWLCCTINKVLPPVYKLEADVAVDDLELSFSFMQDSWLL